MISKLLLRGMLVGVFAGLLAFGVVRTIAEPQIDQAIAFEESHEALAALTVQSGHDHGAQAQASEHERGGEITRATQAGIGALIGTTVFGAAIGGLFSLAFCFLYGRFGSVDPRKLSAGLAFACFVALVALPSLKYPANPPAIGNADTIGERTVLFFALLLISVVAMAAVTQIVRRLAQLIDGWNAGLVGVLAYVVVMALVLVLLPTVNEVPHDFSADLLWHFRLASIGTQATLWATVGVLFGLVAERSLRPKQHASLPLYGG
ncbi:CbtA family protein [Pseudomonas syringae]|uniref:Cobalt transporter CbtA n=1 Tax=Pseudomonas syringae pv. aceris TaxID=199198 RepID=A0A0P9GVG8_PSESX|nr:CbtA family protein [Pseudomonas syringae]KPW09212.1 Uncharacterized protein ALO91_03393 [Pseudomonas syringae pv. aceris]